MADGKVMLTNGGKILLSGMGGKVALSEACCCECCKSLPEELTVTVNPRCSGAPTDSFKIKRKPGFPNIWEHQPTIFCATTNDNLQIMDGGNYAVRFADLVCLEDVDGVPSFALDMIFGKWEGGHPDPCFRWQTGQACEGSTRICVPDFPQGVQTYPWAPCSPAFGQALGQMGWVEGPDPGGECFGCPYNCSEPAFMDVFITE